MRPSTKSKEIKKIHNIMISLDIKGAFDSMVWNRLLTIIHSMSYPRELFFIIKDHQKIIATRLSTRFQYSTLSLELICQFYTDLSLGVPHASSGICRRFSFLNQWPFLKASRGSMLRCTQAFRRLVFRKLSENLR
ncbi:hypothetical protein AVEN_100430-1 [Araneus ventricosus]|uniref:Reverse transcriptase domain-containing protein n=1 Tax=Araneus ventricosus TaxID=182803 RepID=A0A4Y2CYJ1_ARAVE|nr:hypothetical protein AVEN_100430-1 [Araneus ventricosus]